MTTFTEKKYLNNLRTAIVVITLLIPIVNLLIDPTEVFATGALPHSFQINDRFRKVDHLLDHRNKYSGFLLGSSRMGYTDPSPFNSLLEDKETYNLNLSSANAWDYLSTTEFLLSEGFEIDFLIVQLDVTRHFGDRQRYQHHPKFDKSSQVRFFANNLLSLQYKSILGKLWFNIIGRDSARMNWLTGERSRPWEDYRIRRDHALYLKSEESFSPNRTLRPTGLDADFKEATDKTVVSVRDLVSLGERNGIATTFLLTPHNQHYLDDFSWEEFQYLLTQLSKVTEFWCFSGYNSITTDDHNYYESSHYRPFIGDLTTQIVLEEGMKNGVEDFGIYVTPENLREALEVLKRGFEERDEVLS